MPKIRSLCVYCGASVRVAQVHRDAALSLGRLLGEAKIRLIFGGGRVGLMGVMADAALQAGGEVVGVIPDHLVRLEVGHGGASELIQVRTMHERKQRMADLADGFAVLPGGLGTLDETFEIVTWKQLRLHDKPIVLVDVAGYWQPLVGLIEHMIEDGFVQPAHRRLFGVVDKVEDVIPALEAMPSPAFGPEVKWA
ncbi:MAG: TIGR00730 family Rossman fold protein [Alphaproteobacteria bacterium]|nr:TIGR00730 family Rossman fold protein [Alphaproteobacteria bacterium]